MIPQIIYIILLSIGFAVNAVKHGEDKGKYNVWTSLSSTVIVVTLLYLGGFFDCFIK